MNVRFFLLFIFIGAQLASLGAEALCVKSSKANLRSGPSNKHSVTWSVGKYTPLIELSRKGKWIEVEDMDGDRHWIYGTSVTNNIVCVSVQVSSGRLRKAPGLNAELVDIRQVDKYTPFKRLDAQGEWYEVQAGWGDTYWIHESNVWRPVRVTRISY